MIAWFLTCHYNHVIFLNSNFIIYANATLKAAAATIAWWKQSDFNKEMKSPIWNTLFLFVIYEFWQNTNLTISLRIILKQNKEYGKTNGIQEKRNKHMLTIIQSHKNYHKRKPKIKGRRVTSELNYHSSFSPPVTYFNMLWQNNTKNARPRDTFSLLAHITNYI